MPHRKPIPSSQKASLRARKQLYPNATQKELCEWFQSTYNHTLSSGLISDILSTKYNYLDSASLASRDIKRQCRENWPELENILFEWIILVEGQIPLSGEIIRHKAQFFWERLYPEKEMPTFSNGWLYNFQSRRDIRWHQQHGEARDVPVKAHQEMSAIKHLLSTYSLKDQFNCDETALFWKQTPIRSLSTRQLPGRKREKARISALFCCNADGSEKLAPWFIGTAKNPHAFRAAGVNIQNLDLIWKSNQKAWITSQIFTEFLQWFDRQMSGRKVILLMDNFSAHQAAMAKIITSGFDLQNTLIVWLPSNSTSQYQPLDQGIINCWKTHWKRYWVHYILQEFEAGQNPMETMDILKAICWGLRSWRYDVSTKTIENCFKKALNNEKSYEEPIDSTVMDDIQNVFSQLQVSSSIQDLMDIKSFLNPMDETIQDNPDDIDDQMLMQYTPAEPDEEENESIEPPAKISIDQAIAAIQLLNLYEEQQTDGSPLFIKQINDHEQVLWRRKLNTQREGDIRQYFQSILL